MKFEGQPTRSTLSSEVSVEKVNVYDIGDPVVQKTLMQLWAQKMGKSMETRNDIALAWIDDGLATLCREYAESHPDMTVNVSDADKLNKIVDEFLVPNQLH